SGEVLSFPLHTSDEFGVNPALLGNRIAKPATYDRWEAQVDLGDMILFGTDAVSKWALQCLERQRSGLLFESLLGLLSSATSGFREEVVESSAANSQRDTPESADNLPDNENPVKPRGWFRRLWPWSDEDPPDPADSTDARQPTAEVTAQNAGGDGEVVPSQNVEPLDEVTPADSHLKFEQFIERYRATYSELPMRNHDSTLIICVPVRDTSAGQEREALQVISG